MAEHNELGKKGEELAIEYLQEKGYVILEKNYRFQKAEIDIIAKKAEVLIVVEVKTRSTGYFGNPQDFISSKKVKLLVAAADNYINEKELEVELRFDVIALIKEKEKFKIEHLENAFLHF
ncbi:MULTISPECIES: YraN family protein [unclassified Tenacibaculum]|uniref:YraN family protein n=1 Tax=unclassified Tenacibaculum TaxID=2635139 RepID=UPI001F40229D|nr:MULTISPECIES: YraN family protein [unclassified Tenacibaculum]MCF2875974.1 YraN family protein [Tenacibaculum sp. Cn5-1]MCF2936049.1 YraN family protein [Tenacibaculum sp. Cn5-34]MCG7512610.1 YraN family protein [Tenacibaculum sp. Cn5-46]